MIWKHAKSIYIVVFLVINVVFLTIFLNQKEQDINSNPTTTHDFDSTNIEVENISKFEGEKMNIMHAKMYRFDNNDIDNDITNTSTEVLKYVNDVSFDVDNLKQYMKTSVYKNDEYAYDDIMSEDKTIIFNQIIEDKPVFSHPQAQVKFSIDEETKVMKQGYLTDIEESEFSHFENVRNPLHILEELYKEDTISENAKILDATLGYYIIVVEENSGQVIMRPKWQFIVKEHDVTRIVYVDAISQSEKIIEKE